MPSGRQLVTARRSYADKARPTKMTTHCTWDRVRTDTRPRREKGFVGAKKVLSKRVRMTVLLDPDAEGCKDGTIHIGADH